MIRIGILGAAKIAAPAMIQPASGIEDVEVVAVAASSGDRAAAFAERHGIPSSYGGYRQLVEDDGIDAVYNALPPSMHEKWSITGGDDAINNMRLIDAIYLAAGMSPRGMNSAT